jgi:predicted ATPase/DNA-binding SARP family transcriptional activator
VRIGILGPVEVTADGRAVEVGGARLRALLTLLALSAGHRVGVDALAQALWGDNQPADRTNAVQSLVSRLRRAVPGVPVTSGPGGYQLDLPVDAVDAHRFERLAAAGRRALAAGNPEKALVDLREALGLWRGPALADLSDAPPAATARLDELRLTATEDRIEAELRTRPSPALVAELEELAAEHPLRERLCVLRVKALAADGRPARALAVYEEFRRRLADELGVDPSAELRATHLEILRAPAGPPPAAEPARPAAAVGNLRAELTSFVGRDEELAQVTKQLGEGRLVTLVGPGGAGKTRLATVAAARLVAGAGTGSGARVAWLIELAPITDPAGVPRAVLDTVGRGIDGTTRIAEGTQPRDTVGRLVDLLAATDTLLVLDNCEHLVDAAARVAEDLLSRCPDLRVLATSREPLGIIGEALCPVPPLRLPATGAAPADALAYPAVQLLADRAAAVRPGFAVTDDNVRAVVEICRRLDGLPLAIELAAARLRALSPAQVAARLDDRFRLLTGGSRTAMPRHRTLRAVVAWSWDLLAADERRLAERLAVFPATITAESAAGVAGPAAGDLLDALVDKSLVQVVGDGRYRMLETIREFGLERLAAAGEVAAARAAHAKHFLRLVETAEPHLRTAGQVPWLRLLDAERDNIFGALQFACDVGDADTAVRIAVALLLPLTIKGDDEQSASLFARVASVPGPAPRAARATVAAMAMLATTFAGGELPTDDELAAMLAEVRAVDPASNPYIPLIEPLTTLFTDDAAAGLAAVERGSDHPDPWTRAMLLVLRGQIEENDGDAEGMLRDLTAASGMLREIGERWALASCLGSLADALNKRGDFAAAAAVLQESVDLAKEINADDEAWFQRMWLAMGRARCGDVAGARAELAGFVADLSDDPRDGRAAAWGLFLLGELARQESDPDEALALYAASWDRQAAAPLVAPQFRALLRAGQAHATLARGDRAAAGRLGGEAVRLGLAGRDMPVTAQAAVAVVALLAADGEARRAAATLGAADSLRGHVDRSNRDAERLAARLREALGDAEYDAAYAKGWTLDRPGALKLITPDE